MKYPLIILLVILLIALITALAISCYLFYFILNRHAKYKQSTDVLSKDPEEAKQAIRILTGSDNWKAYFFANAEKWQLQSFDNLQLCARFLGNDSHDYAILCHGFTGSHVEMLGRAEHLHSKGFNVLLPDARAHGESEGLYRGMGFLEKKDLLQWISRIAGKDPMANILLFGQSMGAATVMMTAGQPLPPQVKAVIQDCGYTSVWDVFSEQLKKLYKLPTFPIMHIASLISKKKAGYSFKEASPLEHIARCRIPILMIHGEEDTFVPYAYLDRLYERANSPKEKLVVHKAGHCMSIAKDNKLYWDTVDTFIEKYLHE